MVVDWIGLDFGPFRSEINTGWSPVYCAMYMKKDHVYSGHGTLDLVTCLIHSNLTRDRVIKGLTRAICSYKSTKF